MLTSTILIQKRVATIFHPTHEQFPSVKKLYENYHSLRAKERVKYLNRIAIERW